VGVALAIARLGECGFRELPMHLRLVDLNHVHRGSRLAKMLAHYSHVRIEAKRKALDALAVGIKAAGYDTKNDTKSVEGTILSSQPTERIGGDDGTRTRGLCRDRAAF
jgi:hypothetical protein